MTYFYSHNAHNGRQPLSAAQLWELVDGQITQFISERRAFTAYSVTLALRQQHPRFEIMHAAVRARVHEVMAHVVAGYQMTWQSWDGNPARTYVPEEQLRDLPVQEDGDEQSLFIRVDWPDANQLRNN